MTNPTERPHVSIEEAADLLELSRRTIYELIKDKTLASYKLRGRRFVPMAEINRLCADLLQSAVGTPVGGPEKKRPRKRKLSPRAS